jgi:hypothetical protein
MQKRKQMYFILEIILPVIADLSLNELRTF